MYKLLFLILPFAFSLNIMAQHGGGGHGGASDQRHSSGGAGEIFGTIIDSISNDPMPYVSIVVLKLPEDSAVASGISLDNGSFSIENLAYGTYHLKLGFVGFKTKYTGPIKLTKENATFQLKNVQMISKVLDIIEVDGGTPDITYEIDKKVINVEDQLNTEGQTAIEILENIPSVSVSADGTVSLRGSSSFTLLIDGIPTIMNASDALATIPASTIKDIEIITNPSAKYDAEGTSGVINIITKKSKLQGVSCLVNLSAGRFDNYSGDIALNLKKKKITYDISANYRSRNRPKHTIIERTSVYDTVTNYLRSEGENSWKMKYGGFGAGILWEPNNNHVFAVRTNFKFMKMLPYSDFTFDSYDNDSLIQSFSTDQHNNISLFNNTSSLYYQYNIKRDKKHFISFKAIANVSEVEQFDTTLSYASDGTIISGNLYTETGPSNSYRFKVDYQLPLKKDRKLEAGVQTQFGTSGDVGKNYVYNTATTDYDFNALFSSDVDYIRNVHAAYTMFGGKHKSIGYQIGLRAEYTFRTISSTAAVDFTEINRLDWFPSAHFSYGLKNKSQLLVSYSRRIERPRSYFFEPFITWEGPYNVRSGNPNLQPQYINAFEASFMQPIKKKGYFSIEAYFRKNNNIINRISTVYQDGILISQPFNIGTSESYGLEAALSFRLKKWWKIDAGANTYFYNLKGKLNDVDYSAESFNYTGRLTNTFTVKGYAIQFVSRYRSMSVTSQGEDLDFFSQDISLKKSFLKNKLSFTLQGKNILGTARRGGFSQIENVYVETLSKPLSPFIMLSVSIKFNNYQKVYDRNEHMDDF